MPYWKCNKCHHEWESSVESKCDWCGSAGHILEQKTPFERMLEKTDQLLERLKELRNRW